MYLIFVSSYILVLLRILFSDRGAVGDVNKQRGQSRPLNRVPDVFIAPDSPKQVLEPSARVFLESSFIGRIY